MDFKEKMKRIVRTESPEVIAALMADMAEHIESQKNEIKRLHAEQAERDQKSFAIEEKLKLIRRSIYGRKAEKRMDASDRPRTRSQSENLIFSQAMFPTNEVRDESGQTIKTRWADLDAQEIEVSLHEADFEEEGRVRGIRKHHLEKWSDLWEEIPNAFETVTKIEIIDRRYIKKIFKKKKYKLKEHFTCQVDDKDVILTAPVPGLLPGMNYTTDFVASVVSDKYISHIPLERQVRQMGSLGLKGMRNSTLSRLCAVAASALEPIQEEILSELLESDTALHIDETPWGIQNKSERDGFMWIISNRCGSYYFFKPTRSAKVLKEKLKGYSGPVVTDGLETYNGVLDEAKIPHAYCWAHARREFFKIESHDPTVAPILDKIDELFEIERLAKDFGELKRLRETKSARVVHDLKQMLLEECPKSREESQKRKAILYLSKRWPGFELFLTDTRIPLSNNEAERTIRHAVMGRKNYYGSGSHTGAETAATLFTIIESCKKNDLDPRTYLLTVLNWLTESDEIETPMQHARRIRQYR
ncbi:MAG: IS66 family transposase [Oligoflexia bacterium]|nr:IS66 family transposase [Oligoflexia bacterium]